MLVRTVPKVLNMHAGTVPKVLNLFAGTVPYGQKEHPAGCSFFFYSFKRIIS